MFSETKQFPETKQFMEQLSKLTPEEMKNEIEIKRRTIYELKLQLCIHELFIMYMREKEYNEKLINNLNEIREQLRNEANISK